MNMKNYIPVGLKKILRKMFPREQEVVSPLVFPNLKYKKALKHEKIMKIIKCPQCGGESFVLKNLICKQCEQPYPFTDDGTFNFLSEDMITLGAVTSTENVSTHGYGKVCMDLVDKADFVLDAGAGFNNHYHNNVVNLEIVDYATTDVLGICERLPFKDNSFDGIISVAVLEHVKDPFKAADELMRVLKPGGFVFIDVPFLQPFHGYPNHYYNMTSSGVKNLFEGKIDIEDISFYSPLELLPWFFIELLKGIPEKDHNKLKRLRVSDLLNRDKLFEFDKLMSQEAREILAHTTTIVGRKR